MAVSETYLGFVIDQLEGIGRVRSKRMFGGVGLYANELFFGLLANNGLFFKVDDTNRADFEARGMGPFRPFRDKPELEMGYYEVPADVIDEAEELIAWARKAMRVAAAAPRKVKPRKRATPATRPRKPKTK
ncbi:MAG: TfoX/Sxy family protein [Steroidobacteraceae bacterium]|nr:TfoX/Sxy family protein [Steroidobacteraceae bacterium]